MIDPTVAVLGSVGGVVLAVSAYAGDQPHVYDTVAPFFTSAAVGTPVTVTAESHVDPVDPRKFVVVFSEPVGLGSGTAVALPCVVYYDVSLDGDPGVVSSGEWSATGGALRCQPSDPHRGYYLFSDEPSFGAPGAAPLTGFSRTWSIFVDGADVCTNFGNYMCSVAGAAVHLQLGDSAPGSRMVRSDGTPVPNLSFMLP